MKINFLTNMLQMGYAATYGCGGGEATHTCHTCPDGRVREFARVRSAGFVTKSYLATLLATPTTLVTWTAGIASGDIIMLPETSGSYDPGDPKELKGFGDNKVSYGPREMTLMINDPDYADNYAFYNEITDRTELVPFFRTSGLVHIFDKTASIKAKDPVADDLEEEVIWQVECKVTSKNLPTIHSTDTIIDVFACDTF
jgi:hypothetical protein